MILYVKVRGQINKQIISTVNPEKDYNQPQKKGSSWRMENLLTSKFFSVLVSGKKIKCKPTYFVLSHPLFQYEKPEPG